eukprot:CAMPEP_0117676100 /NCGR_PEP_ID=MMETSP0804-20121206/15970_1 /TAXON_ID=1074897 /ORGANISM="Tetraselmis astigmatica, Strain CCMP880" /LENGTH=180 /DNA_ID=CAMNT_0005485171 /DNA_START=377 /DNA_END=918 /DNA_ORIENTATION=-
MSSPPAAKRFFSRVKSAPSMLNSVVKALMRDSDEASIELNAGPTGNSEDGTIRCQIDGGWGRPGLQHPGDGGCPNIPHRDVWLVRARRQDDVVVVAPGPAADASRHPGHLHRTGIRLVDIEDAEDFLLPSSQDMVAVSCKSCSADNVLMLKLVELVASKCIPDPHGEVGGGSRSQQPQVV